MNARLIWKYVGKCMSTKHIQTYIYDGSSACRLRGMAALLEGHDAS